MSDVYYKGYAIEDIDSDDSKDIIHLWGYTPRGPLISKGDKVYIKKENWREILKRIGDYSDEEVEDKPEYSLIVVNGYQRAVRIFSPSANDYVRVYRDSDGHPLVDESGKGKDLMDRIWWDRSR